MSLGETRWLMFEQRTASISTPLLIALIFWLTALFISFGLFAPFNATVVASFFISALSVSGAILLIVEMYTPYAGIIQISSAPLRRALAQLGL
jgi:membrane-bound ClpP family serine protease